MKIYHVFNAETHFLSLRIIETTITYFTQGHCYLLIGENIYKEKYLKMFDENHYSDFYYYSSWDDFKKNNILEKNNCILLHGGRHAWMFYFYIHGFKNVNWICWGSGVYISHKLKSRLSFFYKYIVYRSLNSIVVLMSPEQRYLQNVFGCKDVRWIPYLGNENEAKAVIYPKENFLINKVDRNNIIVYLGNSAHSVQSYIEILDILYHFKENIEIHCMIHYGTEGREISLKKLEEKGEKMYGNRFYMHYELYSIKEYYNFMNHSDVYICGSQTQTGLGAAFACFSLGKKLYLAGRNYEYLTSLGFVVSDYSCISKQTLDEFFKQSNQDKLNNYSLYLKVFNNQSRIKKWKDYYNEIIS